MPDDSLTKEATDAAHAGPQTSNCRGRTRRTGALVLRFISKSLTRHRDGRHHQHSSQMLELPQDAVTVQLPCPMQLPIHCMLVPQLPAVWVTLLAKLAP